MHLAFALDVDGTALFKFEIAVQQTPGGVRYLDTPGDTAGFHAAGSVDNVSPQVVEKLSLADDPRDDRPTVNETYGIVCRSSSERPAVFMVAASPRMRWTRDTQSTPDCAMSHTVRERVIEILSSRSVRRRRRQ